VGRSSSSSSSTAISVLMLWLALGNIHGVQVGSSSSSIAARAVVPPPQTPSVCNHGLTPAATGTKQLLQHDLLRAALSASASMLCAAAMAVARVAVAVSSALGLGQGMRVVAACRCKAEASQVLKTEFGEFNVDNRCWIRTGFSLTQVRLNFLGINRNSPIQF
jgi:hypothetical protein